MSQGFKGSRKYTDNSLKCLLLLLVKHILVEIRSTSPNLTTLFYASSDGSFIKKDQNIKRETLKKESRVQFSSKCNQIKPTSEIKDNSNISKDDFSLKTYPSSFTLVVPELLGWSNEKKSSGIKICPTLSAPIHKVSMDIFHCRYHLKLWPQFRSKFKPRIVAYCIISINSTACLVFMHSRPWIQ